MLKVFHRLWRKVTFSFSMWNFQLRGRLHPKYHKWKQKDLVLPKLPDMNYIRQSIEDQGGIGESDPHFTEGESGGQGS